VPRRAVAGLLALLAAGLGGLAGCGRDDPGPRPAPAARAAAAAAAADVVRLAGVTRPVRLPAPTRFVGPRGDDRGPCTRPRPCRTFDRAFHVARPGAVVELAAGAYGDQVLTPVPGRRGRGCASRLRLRACVVLRPAAGATVQVGELLLGRVYSRPGPAGLAIVAGGDRVLRAAGTTLNQPREVALWGVRMKLLYLTGGRDVGIRGGEVGPLTTPDGTHPEVQRVYGSHPLVVPTRITFEGIHFHDFATTSPTAHVDCLQVENGLDLVLRGNRFTRCGSTGLRLSFGADGNEAPPRRVLVEGNAFGACADTPVSRCYYAAQAGTGVDVLVRGNVAAQALQPAGGARYARRVRYVGNVAPGAGCEPYVRYERNVWRDERCSPSDRRVRGLRFTQRPDGTVRAAARAGLPPSTATRAPAG
jgi:hypothetical protein